MKWIIAIIQPHRLEAVKQCLTEVEVFRLTGTPISNTITDAAAIKAITLASCISLAWT